MCKSRDSFFIQAVSYEFAGERRFATLAALAIIKSLAFPYLGRNQHTIFDASSYVHNSYDIF